MKILPTIGLTVSALLLAVASLTLQAAPLKVSDTAPYFDVTTIDGKNIKLSELTGKKPVYLKFWATWCSYCVAEMPHLQAIHQQYGDQIEVVAINIAINDSVAKIKKLFSKHGYQLPTVFDLGGKLTSQYGVVGTPHHILIDRDGKISYRTFLASDTLDRQIKALLTTTSTTLGN